MLNLIDTGHIGSDPRRTPAASAAPARTASGAAAPVAHAPPSTARRGMRRAPSAGVATGDGDGILVVADVFGGGRNPEWTLDAMETVVLAALLRGLKHRTPDAEPSAETSAPAAPGLLIRGSRAVLPGCREVRLHAGKVLARFEAGDRHLVDPGGAVHAWLLESARHRLSPDAHRALAAATKPAGGARDRR
ncbi:MAG: hypothetical protein JWM27_961 [Gemmatimonadetes bacterium]|nr:hypothetical protein [Gemmatimonadota bacterium]